MTEPKTKLVCQFKRGDKVLVSNHLDDEKNCRYFAKYDSDNILFPYFCFVGGGEWSSNGKIYGWNHCEAYKEKIK